MTATAWRCQQHIPDLHNEQPPLCDYVQAVAVASGVQERVAIPTGATHVLMAGSTNFAARAGGSGVTAAWPTDTTDGTAAELNPTTVRKIPGDTTHISVIAAAAGVVTLSFFRVSIQ
jgi:hypothetical protein